MSQFVGIYIVREGICNMQNGASGGTFLLIIGYYVPGALGKINEELQPS